MLPHSQKIEQVLSELNTNETSGLSASQVAENTQKYGPNKLQEKKKKSNWKRNIK